VARGRKTVRLGMPATSYRPVGASMPKTKGAPWGALRQIRCEL